MLLALISEGSHSRYPAADCLHHSAECISPAQQLCTSTGCSHRKCIAVSAATCSLNSIDNGELSELLPGDLFGLALPGKLLGGLFGELPGDLFCLELFGELPGDLLCLELLGELPGDLFCLELLGELPGDLLCLELPGDLLGLLLFGDLLELLLFWLLLLTACCVGKLAKNL